MYISSSSLYVIRLSCGSVDLFFLSKTGSKFDLLISGKIRNWRSIKIKICWISSMKIGKLDCSISFQKKEFINSDTFFFQIYAEYDLFSEDPKCGVVRNTCTGCRNKHYEYFLTAYPKGLRNRLSAVLLRKGSNKIGDIICYQFPERKRVFYLCFLCNGEGL